VYCTSGIWQAGQETDEKALQMEETRWQTLWTSMRCGKHGDRIKWLNSLLP